MHHGENAEIGGESDFPTLYRARQSAHKIAVVIVHAKGISGVVSGHLGQNQSAVRHRAGNHAVKCIGVGFAESIGAGQRRNCANRRLVAIATAPGGGDADGTAAVGTLRNREKTVSYGGGRTAGGSAGVVAGMEGCTGGTEQVIVASAAVRHGGRICLSQHNCAGLFHVKAVIGVGGIGTAQRPDAAAGAVPAGLAGEKVLQCSRDARKHTDRAARRQFCLQFLCLLKRMLLIHVYHGINTRIALAYALDEIFNNFCRGNFLALHLAGQFRRRHICQFVQIRITPIFHLLRRVSWPKRRLFGIKVVTSQADLKRHFVKTRQLKPF